MESVWYTVCTCQSSRVCVCVCARRLESRMTSDIGAIMQLLQRQMTLVPPAYSSVSSPPQAERLLQSVTPLESDTLASLSQVTHTQPLGNVGTSFREHVLMSRACLSRSRASLWAARWSFIHHRVLCSARAELLAPASRTRWTLSAASLYRNLRRLRTHGHRRNTALIPGARERTSRPLALLVRPPPVRSAPRSFRETLEDEPEMSRDTSAVVQYWISINKC